MLPHFGLSERETSDFKDYWVPRLQDAPYYLIHFLDEDLVNLMVPLKISPPPDTLIRVIMDWHPLRYPIPAAPVPLPAPRKREGFVVVEWGGLAR
jgi:hypothetical protein